MTITFDAKEEIGYRLWLVNINYDDLADEDKRLVESAEKTLQAAFQQGSSLDELWAVAEGIAEAIQFREYIQKILRGEIGTLKQPGLDALRKVNAAKQVGYEERESVKTLDAELRFNIDVKAERWREIAKRLNTSERRVRYILEPPVRRVK